MNSFEKFQRFLIFFLVAIGFFFGGYYFGTKGYLIELKKNPPEVKIINQYPSDTTVDFTLFWDIWDSVSKNYLERPIDPQKMLYGAIKGMVDSLEDPYTSFLPPTVNETVNNSLEGKYFGIGAELGVRDDQIIVVAPLDGSPAQDAGLRAGDKILGIEGKSTAGITVTEAVSQIRGDAGTLITLTVQTQNNEPREVKIKRDVIKIDSVTWKDKGDGTAYIRIGRFGSETNNEWNKVVSEVNSQMTELDAIILDVRGNPGGYLQSSVHISEEFFRGKPVLYQESALGEQEAYMAKRVGAFDKIPAVFILIDGGSASASEILALALRDNINAKLIGTKSYGKGTIQDAENFKDGSGLHLTIAKWLSPKKEWIHEIGIEPEIKVEITDDDINNGRDPQLDKAVELAKEI